MKGENMKNPKRVRWAEFNKTRTYKLMQALLHVFGFKFVVIFDETGKAIDGYMERLK